MKSWKASLTALVLFLILIVGICLMQPKKEDLQLVNEPTMQIDGGIVTIDGQIKNTIPQTYNDVTVTFELLNGEGEIVGKASAVIERFYGNRTWEFSAFKFFALDPEVVDFRLKNIKGTKTEDIAEEGEIDPSQKDLPILEDDDDLLRPNLSKPKG